MSTKPVIPPVQIPVKTTPTRYRPGPFDGMPGDLNRADLDVALKTIYDNAYGQEDNAPKLTSTQKGDAVAHGAVIITGSMKAVATGLRTVSDVVVGLDGSAPSNRSVTAVLSTSVKGAIDIYVWEPAAAGDTTPVAATAPVTVRFIAWGT